MSSVKKVLAVLLLVVLIGTFVVSCKKRTSDNVVEIKAEKVDAKEENKISDSVVIPAETKSVKPEVVVLPEPVAEQTEDSSEKVAEVKEPEPKTVQEPVVEVVPAPKAESVEKVVAIEGLLESKDVEQHFYTIGEDEEEPVVEEPSVGETEDVSEEDSVVVIAVEEEPEAEQEPIVENEFFDESDIEFDDDIDISEIEFNENEVSDIAEIEEFVAPDDDMDDETFEELVARKSDISELKNNAKPLFSLFASEEEPEVEPVVEEVKDDSKQYAPAVDKTIDELIDDLTALEVVKARLRQAEKTEEKRHFGVQFGIGVQYAKIKYQAYNTSALKYSVPIWFNFPINSYLTFSAYLRPAYINDTKAEKGSPILTDSFSLACGLGLGVMTHGLFETKFNVGFEFFNRETQLRKNPCGLLNMQIVPCINLQGTRIWVALPIEASFSFGRVFNSMFAAGVYLTYRSGEPTR